MFPYEVKVQTDQGLRTLTVKALNVQHAKDVAREKFSRRNPKQAPRESDIMSVRRVYHSEIGGS